MARHVERPISLQITRHLALTDIKPTQITMVSMAIGLCGALFFFVAVVVLANARGAAVPAAFDRRWV